MSHFNPESIAWAGLRGPMGGLLNPRYRPIFDSPTRVPVSTERALLESAAAPSIIYTVTEARSMAEQGVEEWAAALPEDDWSEADKGTPLRWVEGKGWVTG
jgi:hypothetical protein